MIKSSVQTTAGCLIGSVGARVAGHYRWMQLIRQFSQVNATLSSPLLVPDHTRLESAKGGAWLEKLMLFT